MLRGSAGEPHPSCNRLGKSREKWPALADDCRTFLDQAADAGSAPCAEEIGLSPAMFTESVARTPAGVHSDPSRRTPSSRILAGKADARSSLPVAPSTPRTAPSRRR